MRGSRGEQGDEGNPLTLCRFQHDDADQVVDQRKHGELFQHPSEALTVVGFFLPSKQLALTNGGGSIYAITRHLLYLLIREGVTTGAVRCA